MEFQSPCGDYTLISMKKIAELQQQLIDGFSPLAGIIPL